MTEAPRWRLLSGHYLNVETLPDGTRVEWEHKETNKANGRTIRKLFAVPMLLDPKDAADHNYPGEIIVAHAVEGCTNLINDYIFKSEPTQEMEPLNEAAQAINDSLQAKWINPIDTLSASAQMSADEQRFMQNMMKAFATAQPAIPVADGEKEELKARLAKLEATIAAMAAAKPDTATARRA
jgi:hypothetical protein